MNETGKIRKHAKGNLLGSLIDNDSSNRITHYDINDSDANWLNRQGNGAKDKKHWATISEEFLISKPSSSEEEIEKEEEEEEDSDDEDNINLKKNDKPMLKYGGKLHFRDGSWYLILVYDKEKEKTPRPNSVKFLEEHKALLPNNKDENDVSNNQDKKMFLGAADPGINLQSAIYSNSGVFISMGANTTEVLNKRIVITSEKKKNAYFNIESLDFLAVRNRDAKKQKSKNKKEKKKKKKKGLEFYLSSSFIILYNSQILIDKTYHINIYLYLTFFLSCNI